MSTRRTSHTALLTVLLISLAACGPFRVPMAPGPVAIKQVNSDIVLAICSSKRILQIVGQYRERDTKEWITFLDARGEVALEQGQEIDMVFISENFDEVVYERPPLQGASINIRFVYAQNALLGSYRLLEGEIPTGGWLHNDETVTEEPCPEPEGTGA